MDSHPVMLYKAGGKEECHGGKFYTLIAADSEAEAAALADGWHLTTTEATAAAQAPAATPAPADPIPADDAAPTRAELEAKAKELNIPFDGRTSDAKLAAKIDEALKG